MKHVSEVISFEKTKSYKDNVSACNKSAEIINILFRELKSIFPAFLQAWPTQEDFDRAKKVWLKAFSEQNITNIEQIKYGLKKCRALPRPFAPSAGEFISFCRPCPKDLGFPDSCEAFKLSARMNNPYEGYIHPDVPLATVIKHVLKQIGASKLRAMPEKEAFKVFSHYYTLSCDLYANGKIQDMKPAITENPASHPSDSEKSLQARRNALESIKKNLGIKNIEH